jgi:hypothetical protein
MGMQKRIDLAFDWGLGVGLPVLVTGVFCKI